MSDKKTRALIRRHYTWPGVYKDVKDWCKQCPKCQLVKKKPQAKAPLHPLPVVSEPFEVLAFDIVGPFERSRQGHKYILTAMYLASKYPEAIPLKDIRAETVAEGMLEIFSRTGIPKTILTDQGQQFIGKLNEQLCQRLNIRKIRTSAYHPQTNGCLERWHGTLTPMIKKSISNKLDWEKQVKLAVFAYRCAPHSNTGLSPFELIYGKNVRGPLEILRENWENQEKEQFNVSTWIEELHERLQTIRDVAAQREVEAKKKMKMNYDRQSKPRELKEGSMVLLRIPGLGRKLDDTWDGPYEVHRKIGDVNYEVIVPNKRKKKKIVHINNCKEWHQADALVLRIVAAAEEMGDEKEDKLGLFEAELTEVQKKTLDDLLRNYQDVLRDEPGLAKGVHYVIETGDSLPKRTMPYRICPAWRDAIKKEISTLLEAGIIEPTTSPWSSSIVPIKKPDGSVRLCIDFRKLNAVTTPDPYCMPLIEDLLDQVGDCGFLSKLDLSKGFYQIPIRMEDRDKTAFCSPYGKYRFTRMPFGLRNAPSTFQRTMHTVLRGQEDHSATYIDDILVYSRT